MKIAVLGTRGIPNNYGGFEQFAEFASAIFVKNNHEVVVYNPADHPYTACSYAGIKIVRMLSREKVLGFLNSFMFDYLCLRHADRQGFDVILSLGYHPAALYYRFKRSDAIIVTNMAGMEWQRSKWNMLAKKLIRHCEKLAVTYSDALVADNEGIANYFSLAYGACTARIAYGAILPEEPSPPVPAKYNLKPHGYLLLIARFQPDNNLEMVLDGYCASSSEEPFAVIGNCTNKYGRFLRSKYRDNPGIRFLGPVYDYQELCSLRNFSRLYFHGHSCGGTNPSLLEAMASQALIVAHDNEFNRSVLGEDAFYFSNAEQVSVHIDGADQCIRGTWGNNNITKIQQDYSWDKVASQYLALFRQVAEDKGILKKQVGTSG